MNYIIDLDERGRFLSHVEDETGKILMEFNEETLVELLEDGFIKSFYDTPSIIAYVKMFI